MREHLSHLLILSVSHSGSIPLLSAPPFDPCLMRVLDHQYSNYITWKRGKTHFLSSPIPQCNPSASLMLSFLMHCLCFFISSPVIFFLKYFTVCNWYTCLYLLALQLLFFPLWSVHFQNHFSKWCIICFTVNSCLFYYLICFTPYWYDNLYSAKRILFSPHIDKKN